MNRRRVSLDAQPRDRLTTAQVFFDDLVYIRLGLVAVPDAFGVDHRHWPLLAAIQTACHVDAHLPGSGKAQLLDLFLAVVAQRRRTVILATGAAIAALVAAEKDVPLEIGFASLMWASCQTSIRD